MLGSEGPASPFGSTGMGLWQWGHSPASMPTLAGTGNPQLGQVLIWTWGSLPAIALGLKHMITSYLLDASSLASYSLPSVGIFL